MQVVGWKQAMAMIERPLAPDFMKVDRNRINQICEIAKKMHIRNMTKKSLSIILNHCVSMIDQSRYGGMQSMNGIRTFISQYAISLHPIKKMKAATLLSFSSSTVWKSDMTAR
jgi:hypothetical protein